MINVRRKSCAANFPKLANFAVLPTTKATTSSLVGVSASHLVPRPYFVDAKRNWYPSTCDSRKRLRAKWLG